MWFGIIESRKILQLVSTPFNWVAARSNRRCMSSYPVCYEILDLISPRTPHPDFLPSMLSLKWSLESPATQEGRLRPSHLGWSPTKFPTRFQGYPHLAPSRALLIVAKLMDFLSPTLLPGWVWQRYAILSNHRKEAARLCDEVTSYCPCSGIDIHLLPWSEHRFHPKFLIILCLPSL